MEEPIFSTGGFVSNVFNIPPYTTPKCELLQTDPRIPKIDQFDIPETYRWRFAANLELPISFVVFVDKTINGCEVYDKRISTLYEIINHGKTMTEKRDLILRWLPGIDVELATVYLIKIFGLAEVAAQLGYGSQAQERLIDKINTIDKQLENEIRNTRAEATRIEKVYRQIRFTSPVTNVNLLPPRSIVSFKHLGY